MPNILQITEYFMQNSSYRIVPIWNYLVSAEYSVRYSAEYLGRNRFRSDSDCQSLGFVDFDKVVPLSARFCLSRCKLGRRQNFCRRSAVCVHCAHKGGLQVSYEQGWEFWRWVLWNIVLSPPTVGRKIQICSLIHQTQPHRSHAWFWGVVLAPRDLSHGNVSDVLFV